MRYRHPENRSKQWVDWREPRRREELFFLWLQWRTKWQDIDQTPMNNGYAASNLSTTGKPMTQEQRCWFSLIYGMTYQSSMSWIIYNAFPDFWNISLKECKKWTDATYRRQKYNKDCRYNQGKLHLQVESLQKIIGPYGSIQAFFDRLLVSNEHQSFLNFYNQILRFYKYGRMTAWLTCQTLFETAGFPIRPNDMLATDPANWSVRSGLMALHNRKDKDKYSQQDLKWLRSAEDRVYKKSMELVGAQIKTFSNYQLESLVCQYKKLVKGNEYSGLNTSNNLTYVKELEKKWPEVNFTPFHQTNKRFMHPLMRDYVVSKSLKKLSGITGQLINLHQDYETMPNMYLEIGIKPEILNHPKADQHIMKRIKQYQSFQSGRFRL